MGLAGPIGPDLSDGEPINCQFGNNEETFKVSNIDQSMRTDNYEYLSKSTVGSSGSYSRSPNNYTGYGYRPEEGYYLDRSVAYPSRMQWEPTPGSDQIKELRHTIDFRSDPKFRQTIQSPTTYDAPVSTSSNYDSYERRGYDYPSTSNYNYLSSSSVVDRSSRNGDYAISAPRYEASIKSPNKQKIVDIDEKYKQYAEAVDKFRDHVETTSKMSEELKKLKEERRKRLEAKQKDRELLNEHRAPTGEVFKKKETYQYYTPKDDKSATRSKFESTSTAEKDKGSNLQKYKTYLNAKTEYTSKQHKTLTPTSPVLTSLPVKGKGSESIYNGQIRDFVLGRLLGEGKFGTVYQGFNRKTGSLYAIKKVPKEMIKSHMMVDQFALEVKLQMYLNHENILTLFNVFDDKTSLYLVLEYMDEGTLFAHLKKNKKLPEPEVAIKIREIASAIKYLHENQIAHRDIKPENIVMSHGVCKLCDFGWATVCDQRRKTYCGTFDYAPPQILEGTEYDYTVDLWCLGVLTYQLLVGKAPFYHISRKQTMKKILNVEKTVIEYPEHLSKLAISFIESLIRKDPKERISSEQILDHPFLRNAGKLSGKTY